MWGVGIYMGYGGKYGYLGALGGGEYIGVWVRNAWRVLWGWGGGINPIGNAIGPGPSQGSAAPCVPPQRGRAPE